MRVLIIGGGGFSAEVADLVRTLGHTVVGYYDAQPSGPTGYGDDAPPIRNTLDEWDAAAAAWAIGDGAVRNRFKATVARRFELPVFVHPSASVSPSAEIGQGSLIMQNVVVNANARVGSDTILNVACCVAHDCSVGDFVHLAPGVQMGGGSSVGEGVFCGTNSTILPGTAIGEWSTCGAGAVVTSDIPARSVAVGVPARVVRRLEESAR